MITAEVRVVYNNLPTFKLAMRLRTLQASGDVAKRIHKEIWDTVPVVTGNLQRSYRVSRATGWTSDTTWKYVIKTHVEYWTYVEFHNLHLPGHPHVRPAIEKNRQYMIERHKEALRQAKADITGVMVKMTTPGEPAPGDTGWEPM